MRASELSRFARYPELRHLNVPGARLFKIRYSPHLTPNGHDSSVLSNPFNVLRPKILDKYSRLPIDTLRWRVVTDMSVKALPHAVLREHLRRRWKEAFRKALSEKGFAKDGSAYCVEGQKGPRESLRGTFEVLVYGGLGFHLEFPKLVRAAGPAIDTIAAECWRHWRKGMRKGVSKSGQQAST